MHSEVHSVNQARPPLLLSAKHMHLWLLPRIVPRLDMIRARGAALMPRSWCSRPKTSGVRPKALREPYPCCSRFARGLDTDPASGARLKSSQLIPNNAIKKLVATWLRSRKAALEAQIRSRDSSSPQLVRAEVQNPRTLDP